MRGGISDPATLGRRRHNRLEQYNSWTKYITYMKKPDNYADTLFVFGFSALYNVSVRIVSDSFDEPHVYYLGATEPADVITVCFLPPAEHFYASRVIAPTITEEHVLLLASQQDTVVVPEAAAEDCTSPVYTNPTEHLVVQEMYKHIS